MQTTSRQRPSLTINAKKASSISGPSTIKVDPSSSAPTSRNPYQTPQASVSNFALYQQQAVAGINPSSPNTPIGKQGHQYPARPRNDSKISVFSDEDDDYEANDDDYDDEMANSLYSHSSLNGSSQVLEPSGEISKRIVFTKTFENLLMNTYQAQLANPESTPFSGRYPPSGIVSKVAKESLRLALAKSVLIDLSTKNNTKYKGLSSSSLSYSNLLGQIRHKLIEMCMTMYNNGSLLGGPPLSANGGPPGRNTSMSSLSSIGHHNSVVSLDDGFSGLSLNSFPVPPGSAGSGNNSSINPSSLFYSNQLTSPQLSPVNHTFSPINLTFNNTFLPEIPNPAQNSYTGSIHEALSSYINGQRHGSCGPHSGNHPLTPITPIAPNTNFNQSLNTHKMMSPTYGSFSQAELLNTPFKEVFEFNNSPNAPIGRKNSRGPGPLKMPENVSDIDTGGLMSPGITVGNNNDVNIYSQRKREFLKKKRNGGN